MAPDQITERDGSRPNPPILGSLGFLVLNLPVGIASFVLFITLLTVGVGTAIVWVGVLVLALAVLLWRGAARLERLRVHAMLGTYIATPYLPAGGPARGWRIRLRDSATWKDLTYFLLMLPVGIAEFTLMVSFWASTLGLLCLPVFYRFLPGGSFRLFDWERPWLVVDSTTEALPFAALGALLLGVTVALTRALGTLHARFARAMLGPNPHRLPEREPAATGFQPSLFESADRRMPTSQPVTW